MDSTGNLFGTTSNGGLDGIGTVFELVSSSGFTERVLHTFGVGGGTRDGYFPYAALTLDSTGKIDSLSLIALGLGPRHDSPASVTRAVDSNNQPEFGRNN